jgi:scyllo-inosamine-4-phosphate amidinotransferase 1
MATIQTANEWARLRRIIVGSAVGAHWSSELQQVPTDWTETPIPSGPVPQWIIDETEEDLSNLIAVLEDFGTEVLRPLPMDFASRDGMYNYCPRDRLLIVGNRVVDCAMMMRSRMMEIEALAPLLPEANILQMPKEQCVLDAANVCRLNDRLLVLISKSGNFPAVSWLRNHFPNHTIEVCQFYSGVHIDSTVVPVKEGLVMLNASRVRSNDVPEAFESWDKIWIDDCVTQSFYQYPYASKWIGMNILVLDGETVVVEQSQSGIIKLLEQRGITVIPLPLRHSRTLGGGFHCVTLDLWRQDE